VTNTTLPVAASPVNVGFTSANTAGIYYCAKIVDAASVGVKQTTGILFVVNAALSATITSSATIPLVTGTGTILTAVPTGGTGADTYQWYTGTCGATVAAMAANAISGATTVSYNTGILLSTQKYSVVVTDASTGTPVTLAGQTSFCVSKTVTVGAGPEGIATNVLNPVTGDVYVANPTLNSLTVIDSFSNSVVVPSLPLGVTPYGLAVDPTDNLIYVSGLTGGGVPEVQVVYGTTNVVVATFVLTPPGSCTTSFPAGMALSPTYDRVYVADNGCNVVYSVTTMPIVANVPTLALQATVNVGLGPLNIAQGPATGGLGYTLFVTNNNDNSVSVLQPRTDGSYGTTTVPVGISPWGVVVNQATDLVYVTNSGDGTVSVLNGATYQPAIAKPILVGGTPEGIDILGASAYVASGPGSNTIRVITLATNALVATPIIVGSSPWGVAALPGTTNYVYVTDSGLNTVSAINTATSIVQTIVVP